MEELDAYADIEQAIAERVIELTQGLATHYTEQDDEVVDLLTEEKFLNVFGVSPERISGIHSVRFVSKKDEDAISIREQELNQISAYFESGDDIQIPLDSFDITTENGSVFRFADVSGEFSANASHPFTAENPEDYKQQAMKATLQDLVLYAANGYSQSLPIVKGRHEVKYIRHGKMRAYFMSVSGEISQDAEDTGATVPERTFLYVGSCQKTKEPELYSELFNIHMSI